MLELAIIYHNNKSRGEHENAPNKCGERTIQELGWEVLKYRPYSLELAPSCYHLFL